MPQRRTPASLPTASRADRLTGLSALAIGATHLARPQQIAQLAGLDDPLAPNLIRASGGAELVIAAGLLTRPRPSGWKWAKVGHDVVDLSLLAFLAWRSGDGRRWIPLPWGSSDADRRRQAIAAGVLAATAAVDVFAAVRATGRARTIAESVTDARAFEPPEPEPDAPHATDSGRESARQAVASITIRRPVSEVYAAWRELPRLPEFMTHLQSVARRDDGTTHWRAAGPLGIAAEWDAELVVEEPDRRIQWRSTPDSRVRSNGAVAFRPAPGDQGTEITVKLEFSPPFGRAGAALAALFGEHPQAQVEDDLRRFKQALETGEVLRSDGSPDGPRVIDLAKQQPAVPMEPSP